MTFSASTLNVFAELLGGYSLPANHPEFDRIAAAISLAKRELAAAQAGAADHPDEAST